VPFKGLISVTFRVFGSQLIVDKQMRELKLTKGYTALVDDEDYEKIALCKWHATVARDKAHVYARNSKNVMLHRFILGLITSTPFVDHKNGDGLDCQKVNLRIATVSQNQGNRRKQSALASSRYKGVSWASRESKWRAVIQHKNLGMFASEKEAAMAYDIAAKEYFKEYALTNF